MNNSVEKAQEGKKSLLMHFSIMLLSCFLLQIFIAARGNHIDLVAQLGLAAVALYYVWYHYSSRNLLSRLRFGRLVAHVVGFLIVNLSYHIHAYILFVTNNPAIQGTVGFPIDPMWFGALFGMMTFWGLGLLAHLIASISRRGFEELARA